MTTRAQLIVRVNLEFPEHWKKIVHENPGVAWPTNAVFPTLRFVEVDDDSVPRGSSCLLLACFVGSDQVSYNVSGCFSTTFTTPEIFTDRIGADTMVEREMLKFLFVNLWGQKTKHHSGMDYWLSLP